MEETTGRGDRPRCGLLRHWRRKRTDVIHFIVTYICTKPIIFCNSISLGGSLRREGQWMITIPYFLIQKPILIKRQPPTSAYSYNSLKHTKPKRRMVLQYRNINYFILSNVLYFQTL
jgi:hypothetical protein